MSKEDPKDAVFYGINKIIDDKFYAFNSEATAAKDAAERGAKAIIKNLKEIEEMLPERKFSRKTGKLLPSAELATKNDLEKYLTELQLSNRNRNLLVSGGFMVGMLFYALISSIF